MTTSRELWLVRHGETTWNFENRLAGWSDVPLTAAGREQAAALRPKLAGRAFDSVWSSDLERAVDTARLAFGEPVRESRLREMGFGELEGAAWADIPAEHTRAILEFHSFSMPGGERFEAFAARVRGFLDELPPGRHLVFTHGGVIRLLTRDAGADRFVRNGALVVIDDSAGRILRIEEPGA